MQTAGGAAGLAYDQTVAYAAYKDKVGDLCEGVGHDSRLRKVTVATGHQGCAFLLGIAKVNAEIAHPSEMTKDTLGRLSARYGLGERISFKSDVVKISDAAKRSQEMFEAVDPQQLLETVDSSYPDHTNVGSMIGQNAAGIYIFNHHPYVGLNRANVHRSQEPLTVQAYHSSTRATYEGLLGLKLPRDLKNLRLAAFILREAATPTVLIGSDPRINILHVVPDSHSPRGLQFEQQYRQAA